jgi:hypothetical protein
MCGEREFALQFARVIEAKLKEKNAQPRKPLTRDMIASCPYDGVTLARAFFDGWLKAEAAHGITKGQP